MTICSERVSRWPHPVAALLIAFAFLGALPAGAQESGRRHGWADEVKRSLDKPDQSQNDMTSSTSRGGRDSGKQAPDQGRSGGQSRDQARF